MKKAVMLLLISMLVSGCGSNFEWFPSSGAFTNTSSSTSTGTAAGTVMKTIPFPAGVTWITDLYYERSSDSFWLLTGTNLAPTAIRKMSVETGQLTGPTIIANSWPDTIVEGSSFVFDGSSFWVTSNGFSGGVPVGEIYRIFASGFYNGDKYNCPATSTDPGFCQGLAWDAATTSFWTAGSNNLNLVNYQVAGGAVSSAITYTGLWQTNGVSDIGFDSATGQALVFKDGIIPVKGGVVSGKKTFTLPGSGKGDWDSIRNLLWIVDNTNKKIDGLFVR